MKKFCFDIDGVICSTENNKYHLSKPNKKAIEKINELYSSGNYIVIFTSRYMGRSKERPAIAKKKGFKFTQKQLKAWGVKFDKLLMGKPSYDIFVDDKAYGFKKKWYNNL